MGVIAGSSLVITASGAAFAKASLPQCWVVAVLGCSAISAKIQGRSVTRGFASRQMKSTVHSSNLPVDDPERKGNAG